MIKFIEMGMGEMIGKLLKLNLWFLIKLFNKIWKNPLINVWGSLVKDCQEFLHRNINEYYDFTLFILIIYLFFHSFLSLSFI